MTATAHTAAPERAARLRGVVTRDASVRLVRRSLWWLSMYGAALVLFGAFAASRGADPIAMYHSMWDTAVMTAYGRGQVLDKAAPFILAGLAVAVPARAGLVNIGGEGQIVIGATAAGGVALALGDRLTGTPALLLMGAAAAACGALWAGIAAVLRLTAGVSEAITTLLLNYVGADILAYFVFGPWKDASGNGQPASKPLPAGDSLPRWVQLNATVGILVALAAAVLAAFALRRTRWGFALRGVGGNPEAARRAGLAVAGLMLSAMLVGGALAGLAGMVQFSGMEGQLRPGIAATFGYTGFLASWLARHQPGKVVLAATLVAGIAVAGNALQISSHLPGSAVNVLLALVLLAVLAQRTSKAEAVA